MTTLLDPDAYPADALAELYGQRWDVEINLRHLKQTMGMDVLRCKTVDGVKKEILCYAIAYNLVRLRMVQEAWRIGVPPNRVSFIDAMDDLSIGRHHALRPDLVINPDRPGRHEPRRIKRRKDRYTIMTQPRDKLRELLGIQRVAA